MNCETAKYEQAYRKKFRQNKPFPAEGRFQVADFRRCSYEKALTPAVRAHPRYTLLMQAAILEAGQPTQKGSFAVDYYRGLYCMWLKGLYKASKPCYVCVNVLVLKN
jgi:hypothetical protein